MSGSLDLLRSHLATALGNGADAFEGELASALLETAQVIVVVLDAQAKVRFVNPSFTELTGWTLDELDGREWFETCLPDEARDRVREVWMQAVSGTPTRGNVNPVLTRDGELRYVKWYDRRLAPDDESGGALLAIGHDVTEQQRTLVERSRALQAVFQASNVLLAHMDRDFDFIQVNRAYAAVDGRVPEDFAGRNHFEMYPSPENQAIFERVRDTGEPHTAFAKPFEYAHSPQRGVTHWDWTLSPVVDVEGRVVGLVLALTDVTTRIIAMEELARSRERIEGQLAEKEVLLREIHHRVKNNLQIISSLLYLQATQSTGTELEPLFAASRARIQAIALVHEILYSSENIGQIDVGQYLRGLAQAARDTYQVPHVAVEIDVQSTAPPLDMTEAVPCGLIVSELIGNAFKHAFEGRDRGRIEVHAVLRDSGCYHVQVNDDGRGMDIAELDSDQTLGMTLIRSLTRQLDGDLRLESDANGSRFLLHFRPRTLET